MLPRLLLIFTAIPLIELYLLFKITEWTGSAALTFGVVVATGVIGALLTRYQGFHIWGRIQSELSAGKMPADVILDALFVFVAGVLLITPGVLTDCVGFTLLIPPARKVIKRILIARLRGKLQMHGWPNAPRQQSPENGSDVIIDSHVVEPHSEEAKD